MQIRNYREVIRLAVSLGLVFLLSLSQLPKSQSPILQSLERQFSDIRVRTTLDGDIDDRIIIVDINDASLQEVGRWPWSRTTMASLINQLFDHYQVNTVGFDIVFAEPEIDQTRQVLKTLSEGALANNQAFKQATADIINTDSADQKLAKALANRNTVTGFIFHQTATTINHLAHPLDTDDAIINQTTTNQTIIKSAGFTENLINITNAAHDSGFFDNPVVDSDGVFRRVPLLQQYKQSIYPSLALAIARTALGDLPFHIGVINKGQYSAIEYFQLGSAIIPLDHQGAVIVPYSGPAFSFNYIPAADVLAGRTMQNELKDKIVLIGTSAPGLEDLRSTPVGNKYPGVEVHASIINGILNQTIPKEPAWAFTANILLVLLTGLLMLLFVNRLSPSNAIASTLLIAITLIGSNFFAWYNGLVLGLAAPLVTLALLYIWQTSYGFLTETRNKRKIAKQFGQYIPPQLVDEMLNRSDELSLQGENRSMTVLFSDVRNFTKLSEGLTPEQLSNLMNSLLTPLTEIIHNNRGTIDKYMGDAIMAFWGAPLKETEHAKLAVKTALEFQKKLKQLQPTFKKYGLSKLEMGIGINTGEMSVGNMGSEFRMAYTVMGDAVNLASRIEELTKEYKTNILISKNTLEEIPDLHCKPVDRIKVKGKSEFIEVFEPIKFD